MDPLDTDPNMDGEEDETGGRDGGGLREGCGVTEERDSRQGGSILHRENTIHSPL